MKKFLIGLLSVAVLCAMLLTPCYATVKSYHWYCVHAKDHIQPQIGSDIAFVEEHFNINEISRITKMLIERQRLDSNGADVLDSCIKSLKAEKNKEN